MLLFLRGKGFVCDTLGLLVVSRALGSAVPEVGAAVRKLGAAESGAVVGRGGVVVLQKHAVGLRGAVIVKGCVSK